MYYCDLGTRSRKGASLDKGHPWLPYSSELWVVNHFSRDRKSAAGRSDRWTRLVFNFREAEREIRAKKALVDAVFMKTRLEEGAYDEPFRSELERALEDGVPTEEPMSRLRERRVMEEAPSPSDDVSSTSSSPVVVAVEQPEEAAAARSMLSISGQPIVRGGYEGMKCARSSRFHVCRIAQNGTVNITEQ